MLHWFIRFAELTEFSFNKSPFIDCNWDFSVGGPHVTTHRPVQTCSLGSTQPHPTPPRPVQTCLLADPLSCSLRDPQLPDLFKLVHLVTVHQTCSDHTSIGKRAVHLRLKGLLVFMGFFGLEPQLLTRDEERVPILKDRKMVAIVKDRRQLQKCIQANSSPLEFLV